jgi:alcohol dehydrogenase class IV
MPTFFPMRMDGNMTIHFEFATSGRIVFGSGKVKEIGILMAGMGSRVMVVSGVPEGEITSRLLDLVSKAGYACSYYEIDREPTTSLVKKAVEKAREEACDFVIGFGGGSGIDAGKAVAALLANPGDIMDYLEVVGKGMPLNNRSFPFIAIPTTAGTGSEVTRNAVIEVEGLDLKVSLRSQWMLPLISLVDPELTCSLPSQVTASTGMDALTQLIEPFVSNRANPLTDGVCREGLQRVARYLRRAYENGKDLEAREGMSLASLLGGMALANAGLGAVHGFAAPLGGLLHAPHGAICARLLPVVMDINVKALMQRKGEHDVLPRYVEIAQILTGRRDAAIEEGILWIHRLSADMGIIPLRKYGLNPSGFKEITTKAARASSMQGNPIVLNESEFMDILERAY